MNISNKLLGIEFKFLGVKIGKEKCEEICYIVIMCLNVVLNIYINYGLEFIWF